MARIENSLSEIGAVLEGWSCKVAAALAGTNESSQTKLLLRARVDYGIACYRIIRLLQHTETQIRLCSDLVFWMRRAGNLDAAREYGDQLVSLLQAQGHSQDVAQALCNQGTRLFLDHQYEDAANKLRQASFLAESLGDRSLRKKCDQFLGYTEFFLR